METDGKVAVLFTVNDWNAILNMLAKQPYEVSAQYINQIAVQVNQQQSNNAMNGIAQAGSELKTVQ